jgi:branched-chain amino acid transport system substrate-binding protein
VRFIKLHGAELSDNARSSVEDKSTVAYLGELEPGTSQVSVEINNELGILQVSPVDTAIYLTQSTPAVPGAPGTFYPSSSNYHETFARVVPNSAQEAKALVTEMQSLHLSKLYVASDGGQYGASIALEVRQDAPSHGLSIVSSAADSDAVFFGGNIAGTATRAVDQAAAASPSAKLFVSSALYDDGFVAGLSAAAQHNLYVSSPGFLPSGLTPAGRQFVTAFRTAYGHSPAPQAIFGYEAMAAVLAVLKEAGTQATNRSAVVSDFRTLKNRQSVLGTYSIVGGDTNIAPFIFARPEAGKLVPRIQG